LPNKNSYLKRNLTEINTMGEQRNDELIENSEVIAEEAYEFINTSTPANRNKKLKLIVSNYKTKNFKSDNEVTSSRLSNLNFKF
jgi:hypothetical protein